MSTHALYLVRMDVAHDHEATFNEVYDVEHLPNLRGVPGVRRASRYRQPRRPNRVYRRLRDGQHRRHQHAGLEDGRRVGRWPTGIRPHTMNRFLTVYEWVGGAAALTGKTPYVFWVMMDIEPHREALFNELYDHEHLPLLLKLPGRSTRSATGRSTRRAALSLCLRGREHRRCRCPSCGTTPPTSGAGSPRCGRTRTTSATS